MTQLRRLPTHSPLELSEVVSWLAWGEPITAEEFRAGEELDHFKGELESWRKRLQDVESTLAKHGGPPGPGSELSLLVHKRKFYQDQLGIHESALNFAEIARAKIERVSGERSVGGAAYLTALSKAYSLLCKERQAERVAIWAKRNRDDQDWQRIPTRWFWKTPLSRADLNMNWIERGPSAGKSSAETWIEIRVETKELKHLVDSSRVDATPQSPRAPHRPEKQSLVREALKEIPEALAAQSAVFTGHPEPATAYEPEFVEKMDFPPGPESFRIKLLLDAAGINQASLFPGIDGLASHVGWRYKWGRL